MLFDIDQSTVVKQLFPQTYLWSHLFRLYTGFNFEQWVGFGRIAHIDNFAVEVCGGVLWENIFPVIVILIQQTLEKLFAQIWRLLLVRSE